MNNTMSCTSQQIQSFKDSGFLIIENLIEPDTLELWREQIWGHFGSRLDTPETWPDVRVIDGFKFDDPEKAFGRLPEVAGVVQQLLGGDDLILSDGDPLFTWPAPETEWYFPHTSHIDGYGTEWGPFMLGATTYLYDVHARGGGFGYWPGSHLTTHQYFLEDPDQVDGRFQQRDGWSWRDFSDRATEEARQFTARAGDVMFWHAYLVHGASLNARPEPRFGIFARFRHEHQDKIKREVPEDLWKHWVI
jgi:hypothetical protein